MEIRKQKTRVNNKIKKDLLTGSYCLVLRIKKDIKIKIGKLGKILFKKGIYIYIGSGMNNLIKRIERHLGKNKKSKKRLHWHIDYLLQNKDTEIIDVFIKESTKKEEEIIANFVKKHSLGFIKNFGATDSKLKSHLYYVKSYDFLNEKMKRYTE